MAKPWLTHIRDTGTLTIFNGMSAGIWANIFALALRSFNRFSEQTGVTLVKARDKQTANVIMKLGDGAVSYDYRDGNQTKTRTIEGFSGTTLHGLTGTVAYGGEISKAHVFLPVTPQVTDFDRRGNEIKKSAGQGILECIAVHELIHAAGLDKKSDHGGDGVFYDRLTPQDGKMYVPEAGKNQRLMPPVRFGDTIVGKLKELW
jgi:hypothetical protein